MANCGICNRSLSGVAHKVELMPGVRINICHDCHVELADKITDMTLSKAELKEVNGL